MDVARLYSSIALQHGNNSGFVADRAYAILRPDARSHRLWLTPAQFTADICFINFNNSRELRRQRFLGHRIANTMSHEPCTPVSDLEHAVELMSTYALLAGA